MAGKRDAAYYRARLRRDHPTVSAGLSSGKYASVREAAAAAGLIRLPSRLDALKREWNRASKTQHVEFINWLKAGAFKRVAKSIADSDGRLRSDVKAFLSGRLRSIGWTPGRLMKEIGFKGYDYTLSSAILSRTTLRPAVIPKLTAWLKMEGFG